MAALSGVWDLTMRTPIGSIPVVYTFDETGDGLVGTAASRAETVELHDVVRDGETVTWRQSITKPIRLHLHFEVRVTDDTLTGHSRAGRLPRSAVTGVRRR